MPFFTDQVGQYAVQDPDENLDYSVDYVKKGWLGATDTIQTSTWIVDSAKLIKSNEAILGGVTQVFLAIDPSAVEGSEYQVLNRIVTAAGRKKDVVFRILVRSTT